MHLYKSTEGNIITLNNNVYLFQHDWDDLINRDNLHTHLLQVTRTLSPVKTSEAELLQSKNILAPVSNQEVWAAGVTYLRSRDARMEESKDAGASDCYQKVYEADRPELFFKSLPHRVAAHNEAVLIRKDSTWNVPEPELTLLINSSGSIQGYTIGNDMSSRSIEGENPLYLPQAKMYERSVALGPCVYVPLHPIDLHSSISIIINRDGKDIFNGTIKLKQMKRQLTELVEWLFAELRFQHGCFLMTGTGIVPPDHFTLNPNDRIAITIENIGTLVNTVQTSK